MGADELHGKTIENVAVYRDAVLMTTTDGRAVAIFKTEHGFRVQVGSHSSPDMPVGVRVYLGEFAYPGELPESAIRS